MVGADAVPLPRPRHRGLSDRIASHSYGLIRCRQRIATEHNATPPADKRCRGRPFRFQTIILDNRLSDLRRDPAIAYSDVAPWRCVEPPNALGYHSCFTARATPCSELEQATCLDAGALSKW